MEYRYSFAGIDFVVDLSVEREYADTALTPFRVSEVRDPHRFLFELVEELPSPQGPCISAAPGMLIYEDNTRYLGAVQQDWHDAHIRVTHRGKVHQVQLRERTYPRVIASKTVLNCLAAEHLLAENRGFVFHCAFISSQGKAVLFTAPSGTGKSTQAELWQQHRGTETVNGDRAAVRITDDGPIACGIPFAGSSGICKNQMLPLAAVVYLKQAPETTIRCLRGAEAFRRVWEGISVNVWDRADVDSVSESVQQLLMTVPVYELACTPDESAILALEGVLE